MSEENEAPQNRLRKKRGWKVTEEIKDPRSIYDRKSVSTEKYYSPCGLQRSVKPCTCSSDTVTKYQRISGRCLIGSSPHEVPRVEYDKLPMAAG
jgi:hypothetical protein